MMLRAVKGRASARRKRFHPLTAPARHGRGMLVGTWPNREIAIKSMDAQTLQLLLTARAQLVSQRQAIANNIRGLLKTFGHVIRRGCKGPFASRVREAIDGNAALSAIIEPLLISWQALRDQAALYNREITMKAKSDDDARRLMTVPGMASHQIP